MEVSKYNQIRHMSLPVFGAGADVPRGAVLRPGATAGTNNHALVAATGFSAVPNIVGVLNELHDYSVTGDPLMSGLASVNGSSWPTHDVELAFPARIFTVEFSQSADDDVAVTSQAGTTLTITSLEDDIDASFIYVVRGAGAGQLQYLSASAAGSATLKAAFTTTLDTTSRIIKILRRFHDLVGLNADGTLLASQAAAGSVTALILDIRMISNERDAQLSPLDHPGLTGLQNRRGLRFVADLIFRDTAAYTID